MNARHLLRGVHGRPLNGCATRPGFQAPWGSMDPNQLYTPVGVFKTVGAILLFSAVTFQVINRSERPFTMSKRWIERTVELEALEKRERGF